MEHQLGSAPIEDSYRAQMNAVAKVLDVHYAEHVLWCAHCCPSCATRPPLAEGEVKPVEGEQGGLFT